jgi:hypothetical protein
MIEELETFTAQATVVYTTMGSGGITEELGKKLQPLLKPPGLSGPVCINEHKDLRMSFNWNRPISGGQSGLTVI